MLLCCAVLAAQEGKTPASRMEMYTSALSYRYAAPQDWIAANAAELPSALKQNERNTVSDEQKKEAGCVQRVLSARHDDGATALVVVELPFACMGASMSEKDLPGFAQGAAEGMKQSFELANTANTQYKLGSHAMWLERAKGNPKGHPEATADHVEIACTLLKKGAVCWLTMAANGEDLKAFEDSLVALEGDAPTALVPSSAFKKKPE